MNAASTEASASSDPDDSDGLADDAVRAMMDAVRSRSLQQVSLADIARSIGSRTPALLDRFGDFDGLVVATLRAWGHERMARVGHVARSAGTVALLRDLLEQTIEDPACSRLVTAATSIAASPGGGSAAAVRELWVAFHATVQRSLARDIEFGRQPPTMDPAHGTEQLLAIYEGLQFQWFLRPHMNLLASYDRATTRLQTGWSERYTEPVWSI